MTDELEDQMLARAQISIDQDKAQQALDTTKELSEIGPKDAIVWFIKGKAHYAADQFDEALSCFSQAATIENERSEVWLMMGYSLIALRRYEEALPSLEYVKGVQPDNIEATCALCIVHAVLGHISQSRDYFDQAAKADKEAAVEVLERFYEDFFSKGAGVDANSKAQAERLIHKMKIT